MKRKEEKGVSLIPKVVATGVLVLMMCSMAPSNYAREGIFGTPVNNHLVSAETARNANKSLYYPGVTIADGKITYRLPTINSKNAWSYTSLSASVLGKRLSYDALVMNSTVYLPLRQFGDAIGARVVYNSATRTMTLTKDGFTLTATDGGFVTNVNGRQLFGFSPNVIMTNGRMYIPASTLAKASGLTMTRGTGSVSLNGAFKPITDAAKYYNEDEVFWLARIITAEARGESLLGQIAVGNVIMNRVASRSYPDTIYGVIFDRKWGVQFSPVLDKTIYNTPTYTATLAAKICLEGTKLSEDSLFFLNPVTAESSWIIKSREYLYTIGGHDFYR